MGNMAHRNTGLDYKNKCQMDFCLASLKIQKWKKLFNRNTSVHSFGKHIVPNLQRGYEWLIALFYCQKKWMQNPLKN